MSASRLMSAGKRLLATVALVSLGVIVAVAPAEAAPAAPGWSIAIVTAPTIFEPGTSFGAPEAGPLYQVQVTNVGGTTTSGTFTVRDALPAGVSLDSSAAPYGEFGLEKRKHSMTCGSAGQLVTCTGAAPALNPGEEVVVNIPIDVASTASGVVSDVAEVSGGGAAPASTSLETPVESTKAPFTFVGGRQGLFDLPTDADGAATSQAGAHPYQLSVGLGFSTYLVGEESYAAGSSVKDFSTTLPAGMVVNPEATPVKCTETQLESSRTGCPLASQVGTIRAEITVRSQPPRSLIRPLYNVVAPHGVPAQFGFELLEGVYIHLQGALRGDHYELGAEANDILAKTTVLGGKVMLWGDPSAASHDSLRGECLFGLSSTEKCELETRTHKAFISMPSACSGQLLLRGEADSWADPLDRVSKEFLSSDANGNPLGVGGCSQLSFEPAISVTPEVSTADSPTGLSVAIKVPQNEEYENAAGEPQLATANLKDVNVALPTGMTVNPAAADGLAACEEGQIGYSPETGHFNEADPQCPDGSKVGSLEVETPLLDHTLPGSVYLAKPYENPFDSLLALYVVIDDPQSGIVVKLPGHVVPDQRTGQLTATFAENPQIPFSELRLHFFGGPRASLASPEVCGNYATKSQLGPWSGTAPVALESAFATSSAPGGGNCASTPGQMPNSPAVGAGTTNSTAGAYAPFVLNLKREDGSQRISALNVTLPLGETGKLAGIPYCSDGDLAAAAGKEGRAEQASPSCPQASEVGSVTVGAGVGPSPYFVGGKAYLAGPYKGAPLSLAIITPAVAGPFDLGTVVVRSALYVDPFTTQISVVSDPLPTILQGIPLDVRSIAVAMKRPDFTLNPTNCEPSSVLTKTTSVTGATAQASNAFQVGKCKALGFKPKVSLSIKGSTKHAGHPALKAVVTYPQQGSYANIARAQVNLPHSEFIDQGNLNKTCTKPVLIEGKCPATTIYGKAKAWTPLLDKPLEGPVYLVGGFGYKLPALVAELNGQVRFLLVGKVDSGPNKGIRNTFETVPDAPVSRFVLEMKGGPKYSLLENSEPLCKRPQRAIARFRAQNGTVLQTKPLIANSCKKKGQKGKGKKHHAKHKGHGHAKGKKSKK
jgi:hypothetical protein